ncbi:hypothetical protein N0V88_001409 [Collariella sp. IMI 366227]|nr:hypothetical protein N0V88_001409 [Collariella sp. IMI 366227]
MWGTATAEEEKRLPIRAPPTVSLMPIGQGLVFTTSLTSLAEDLADLVESVQAVESNPSQYGLSAAELTRRKRLVQEVGGRKGQSDLPDPSAFAIPDGEGGGGGEDADYAAEFEREQQVVMMREQDEHLDGVFQTVGNLRRQADDMGRELEEQVEMLEVVDDLAERVGGRLQTGMEKLKYVMRRSEDRWDTELGA